jgi:phytoene synthase
MHDAYAHCEALVREADKDRFLAGLFAPAERRHDLFALYAFVVEIGRARELAREPMPGEIRLQWWRDALGGHEHGGVGGHPVAAAVGETIARRALPVEPLIGLIDAHAFDLYDDPVAGMGELENRARATSSAVFALAARILGADGEAVARAADAGGIAYALAGLLRAFPRHVARRQLYLPTDLMRRHDVAEENVFAGQGGPGLVAVLADVRASAEVWLDQSRAALAEMPPQAGPAFLVLALVKPTLRALALNRDPYRPVEVTQWRRQWALWRAARRRRVLGVARAKHG